MLLVPKNRRKNRGKERIFIIFEKNFFESFMYIHKSIYSKIL